MKQLLLSGKKQPANSAWLCFCIVNDAQSNLNISNTSDSSNFTISWPSLGQINYKTVFRYAVTSF